MGSESTSASTPSSSQPQPGLWIQYKSTRARTIMAGNDEQESGLTQLRIVHEFLADLRMLFLEITGVLMDNVVIVWGSGLVRANYGVHGREFCEIVKFMIERASTEFTSIMIARSIAHIRYIEDGVGRSTFTFPDSTSNLMGSPELTQLSDGTSTHISSAALTSTRPTTTQSKSKRPNKDRKVVPVQAQAKPPVLIHPERLAGMANSPTSAYFQDWDPLSQHGVHALPQPQPRFHPLPPKPVIQPAPEDAHGGSSVSQRPHISPGPQSSIHPLAHRQKQPQNDIQSSTPRRSSATKTIDSRLRPVASQCARPALAPNLTAGACVRLRDPADDAILTSGPIVQLLVLRGTDGRVAKGAPSTAREAYVTDGSGYTWIRLPCGPDGHSVDRGDLQIGAAAKLGHMSRLSSPALCAVLVHKLDIVTAPVVIGSGLEASSPTHDSYSMPPVAVGDNPAAALQHERVARLLAESQLQDERRRRVLVENLLADVCRELDKRDSLVPAAMEALTKLAELTDAAMLVD